MIRAIAVLLFASLTGCYAYRPATTDALRSGQRVQLILSEAGTRDLAATLGPSTSTVSGRIVADSAGALLVSVRGTRTLTDREADWAGEHVLIPRPLIAELQQRQFSRSRTAVAAIVAVAAGLLAREAFVGPGSAFGGSGPGGIPGHR